MKSKTNHLVESKTWTMRQVAIGKMLVRDDHAQRDHIDHNRVAKIVADFDLDMFEPPTLSEHRPGEYYIIDGQHRIEAIKRVFDEDLALLIDARVFQNMSAQEEAELFLVLNTRLAVNAHDKFRVGVNAGRNLEVLVQGVVEGLGLKVSPDQAERTIGCVNTLMRVAKRTDTETLSKTLRIAHSAFGDAGLESPVIDGLAHLCQRYNGALPDEKVVMQRLRDVQLGVDGLLQRARTEKKATGKPLAKCVAAAASDIVGKDRGGRKLPNWWKPYEVPSSEKGGHK